MANAAARRLGMPPDGSNPINSGGPGSPGIPPGPDPMSPVSIFGSPDSTLRNGNGMGGGRNPNLIPQPPGTNVQPIGQPTPIQGGPTNPLSGGTGDPNLDKYLGTDSTYQSQLSDLMRQYDQYNAQKNLTASQTQADYDAKERALSTQTAQDQLNMRNAAAARGILYSGIYANQLGQYNTANQQQMTNLLGGLQNAKDNAALQYNQFISNELAAKESAIQQAAARRATQLGLI